MLRGDWFKQSLGWQRLKDELMIPANEAFATARSNACGRWNAGETTAEERLASRLVVPEGKRTFSAKPTDTFFAIGSCFARNVEERLELAGARVTSREIAVRDLGNTSARQGGIFNKYTPTSILQELEWAVDPESFPSVGLLPAGPDLVYDPFLSGKAGTGTVEELMERRREIAAYFAQAFEADVVVVTLGLIECWLDKESGLMLNEAPSPRLTAAFPDRFQFHCLSVDESRLALRKLMRILRQNGKKGQRQILTVSPVPLGRTFTADDVIVANATSKSTLRVVAKEFSERAKKVDYFPSYEAVTSSDPRVSWQKDRRHVSDFVVGRIINTFLSRYGITSASADKGVDVTALENDENYQRFAQRADSPDELLAILNSEVNKYKNMVLKLQADLRKVGQP